MITAKFSHVIQALTPLPSVISTLLVSNHHFWNKFIIQIIYELPELVFPMGQYCVRLETVHNDLFHPKTGCSLSFSGM